jgi:hypothetical protein
MAAKGAQELAALPLCPAVAAQVVTQEMVEMVISAQQELMALVEPALAAPTLVVAELDY